MIALERSEDNDAATVYTDDVYDIVKVDSWIANKPEIDGFWEVGAGFIRYEVHSESEELLSEFEDFVRNFDGYHGDAEYVFRYLYTG